MGLKVWLPLNGDLHNQGTSNYAISVFRGTETYDNNGKIGKCFYAHGTNALKILNILPDIYNYSAYSLCAWCYVEAQNTSHSGSGIISGGNWNNQLLNLAMSDWSSDHYTKLRISGSNWSRTYNYNFYKNIWYHIVVCDDGTHTYGYVNGTLIGDTATSFLPTSIEGTDICIGGATYYAGMQFFGKINDVRIYDHCLSAAEVREISQGLVLHYKLDDIYSIATINQLGNKSDHFSGWGSYGFGGHGQTTIANISPALSGEVGMVINKDNGNYDGEIAVGVAGYNLNKNESITFSAYVKGNGNTIGKTGYIWIYKSNGTNTISTGTSFVLTAEWQRVKHTITWTYDNPGTTSTSCYIRCNRAQNESFYISNCQLESGTIATGFTNTSREAGVIQDSSGYGHNGSYVNATITRSDTRYSNCISCLGTTVDGSSNTITGAQFFYCNMDMPAMSAITVAWWGKNTQYSRGGIFETSGSIQTDTTKDSDHGSTAIANWDTTFRIYNGSSSVNFFSNFIKDGNWHHHSITFDGANAKYYCDGTLKQTGALTGTLPAWKSFCMGLGKAGGVWRQIKEYVSDLRIYCTALSAADIKQLYELGAKVDNQQNLHTFEIIEPSLQKITKRGQIKGQNLLETYLPLYDKTIYTEPDGSTWIHIFHHNNPAASKFNETNLDWTSGKYLDADRWYDVDQAIYSTLGPYEFMVKQKTTSSAAEAKYRWTQSVSPLTAVWEDVKPGQVTFNTTTGYTNSSYGGMYIYKSTGLHMCIANGSKGNWYGGIGAASAYNGGIPGFPNTVVTTGSIDLYIRIYNGTKIIKDIGMNSNEFIEI